MTYDALLNSFTYQIVAAFMMMKTLNNMGFRAFQLSIPSPRELLEIFEIAAPVFITMTSKVTCCVLSYLSYRFPSHFPATLWLSTSFSGGILLPTYLFCNIYGNNYCCCSSGTYISFQVIKMQLIFSDCILLSRGFWGVIHTWLLYCRLWLMSSACVLYGANPSHKPPNHLCRSWYMELIGVY